MPINEHGEMLVHIKGKVDDFNKKYDQVISKGEQMKQKFQAIAKFIAGAYVAGRIIGAFKKIIGETIEMGVELDKLRKQWGMTAVEIQRVQYAATKANVDFNNLKTIFPKLAKAMSEARDGMPTYKDEFDKMGISVTDSEGKLKKIYDLFLEISDWMTDEGVPDIEKLASATALLGRRGAEMIPFFMKGRIQLELWGDEAERMVGTLSDDMVNAILEAKGNLIELNETIAGFKTYLGVHAIPVLNEYVERYRDLLRITWLLRGETKDLNRVFEIIWTSTIPGLGLVWNKLKKTMKGAGEDLEGYFATVEEAPKKIKPLTDALDKKTEKLKEQAKEEKYFIEIISPKWEKSYRHVGIILNNEMIPGLRLSATAMNELRQQTRITNSAFIQLGSTIMNTFKKGKIEAADFLKIITSVMSRMLLVGAPGPFQYFLSGFFGSFERGGAMFLKDFRPRLMQEGGATIIKEPTAATPMGNIAHKGEVILTPEQTMDIINRPIYFNVFNADPDLRIERIMESSMGAQQKFGRFLEEKVLRERDRLKGNE